MKFNFDFDNIVEKKNLRGEYEIDHKKYISNKKDKFTDSDTILFKEEDYIVLDSNKIKNKKKYKTVVDKIELISFNTKYVILLQCQKDDDIESLSYAIWKIPLTEINSGDYVICKNIVEKIFVDENNITVICIKEKEFLDDNSEFILKNSLNKTISIKTNKKHELCKSYCITSGAEYTPLYVYNSELIEYNDIFNRNEFGESYVLEDYTVSLIYKNQKKIILIFVVLSTIERSFVLYAVSNIVYSEFVGIKEIDGVKHIYFNKPNFHINDDIHIKSLTGEEFVVEEKNKLRLV